MRGREVRVERKMEKIKQLVFNKFHAVFFLFYS